MQDRIGQQFGSYRLVSLMGQGGFADVYLAQHLYLERQAAIKILQTRLSQQNQEAFLREARTIADLVHPNIIRVLDFGVEGTENIPFLVMEYAPHGSLRHRYPMGSRLHVNEVITYVKQVAAALQYAHDRKIVHRDVKPENMLIGQDGSVLLSDFGLAVISQTSRPGTQDIHGTVAYMAPEQLRGHPQSASDQYALAMTAYELLCGEVPFKGSFAEVGSQHLFEPVPSLKDKVPQFPTEVDRVIMTALSKDPLQRFATVQAFANALAQAAVSSGTATASGLSDAMMSSMADIAQVPPPPPGYIANIPVPPPPMMYGSSDPTNPGFSRNLGQQITPSQLPMGGSPNYPSQGSGMQSSGGPFGSVYGQRPSGGAQQGPLPSQTIPPANQPSAYSSETIPVSPAMGSQITPSNTIPESWNAPNAGMRPSSSSQNALADTTGAEPPPVTPGKPKKSGGHAGYIAVIVVLLLIILSGGIFAAYAAFIHNPFITANTAATATVVPTPDLTATARAVANNATPTPSSSTTTPTVAASATATAYSGKTYSQDVQNLTLTCINSCSLTLVVNSVTINAANSTMQWNFTVTNNGANSSYVSTSMDLEDLAGHKIEPSSGNFTEYNTMASGQSLPLLAIFSSVPQTGLTYLMHSSASGQQYQTLTFVFHA